MSQDFYEEIAPIYDRMIRWERRLKLEEPLFEAIWKRAGTRTVLDAACGSGRHLVVFARQGLEVTGTDASAAMLRLAREQVGRLPEPGRPRLGQSAWAELPGHFARRFDAVLCLGNSLPYATEFDDLCASLQGMWSRVAPGGMLLIQYRNFTRMRAKGERFLPLSSLTDAERGAEYLCVRQYDWRERTVDFNVIMLSRDQNDPAAEWVLRHWTTPLAAYSAHDIAEPLESLGAKVYLYGSLGLEPYDESVSDDVVIWAQRVKA